MRVVSRCARWCSSPARAQHLRYPRARDCGRTSPTLPSSCFSRRGDGARADCFCPHCSCWGRWWRSGRTTRVYASSHRMRASAANGPCLNLRWKGMWWSGRGSVTMRRLFRLPRTWGRYRCASCCRVRLKACRRSARRGVARVGFPTSHHTKTASRAAPSGYPGRDALLRVRKGKKALLRVRPPCAWSLRPRTPPPSSMPPAPRNWGAARAWDSTGAPSWRDSTRRFSSEVAAGSRASGVLCSRRRVRSTCLQSRVCT